MEQTTQKRFKITKNTAILGKNSFEGRCLLFSLTNKEQFLDHLEDIYEELKPDKVEIFGEYENEFICSNAYQEVKDLDVKINSEAEQVIITWSEIVDEEGTLYGKSFFKNANLEHVLDIVGAFDKADQETKDLVMQTLAGNQFASI
jgi:hypothetical protein